MSPSDPEFHDPVLKDAVRRCWACDCAPKELHSKVADLVGGTSASGAAVPSRELNRLRWMIWPVGLAACLVLSFTVLHRFQNPPASAISDQTLPVSLETDLVQRHDACCQSPDHQHLAVSRNDDIGITAVLHNQLNRPVLMFRPDQPGWQFRGAAICPVGTTPAGHLVFIRGSDALSIFSLPHSTVPSAAEGSEFATDFNQHHIVGFVKDGAFFCLVGSGPGDDVNLDELKKMQSQMQPSVARLYLPEPSPVLLTELLRPIRP